MRLATSLAFARQGATVVIGDVDERSAETVELIEQAGGSGLFVRTDVSVASEVEALVKTAVDSFGGMHVAFNNAGVLPPTAPLAEQAWRVLTPVLEAWSEGLVPLEEYPAGSAGPP